MRHHPALVGSIESEQSAAALRAAERAARRAAPAPGRGTSHVERRVLRVAVAIALTGALVLIVSEFLPLLELRTRGGEVASVNVGPHHSWAGLLLALGAIALALAFARTGARPPALAVAALGVAAVLVALIGDVPDTRAVGAVGRGFTEAHAHASVGAYSEALAGILIALGGALGGLMRREDGGPGGRTLPPADQASSSAGAAAAALRRARVEPEIGLPASRRVVLGG